MIRIILASGSQARASMLRASGVSLDAIIPARVDEDEVKASFRAENRSARDLADALAEIKARRVSAEQPDAFVIGADQVLVHQGDVFNKPGNAKEAREQLIRLRGSGHELLSAAVICEAGKPIWRHIGAARLTMRPFSDAFLDQYIDAEGERMFETVGGYRIEETGAQLFSRISGDYFSILGLPLLEVMGFLRARGVLTE